MELLDLFITGFTFIFLHLWWRHWSATGGAPKNLPPGPPGWPLVGNLIQIILQRRHFIFIVRELRKLYGPIFTMQMGQRTMVIVTDSRLIHEALVQRGPVFASRRPGSPIRLVFSVGKCAINSAEYGPLWRTLRKNFVTEMITPARVKQCSWIRKWAVGSGKSHEENQMRCFPHRFRRGDEQFDGTDTSATTVEWDMLHLVTNQGIQEKLYQEILDCVGVHVEFYTAWITENPDIWSDPGEFRPERFTEGDGFDVDMTGTRAAKMLPFGAGRRIFPACNLGVLHIKLMLAKMVQAFKWLPVTDSPPDMAETYAFTVVTKNPLKAVILPRQGIEA
ncbi:adenosine deaminase-like protein-like isoform X1 [Hibiscus syriacus]|uniref:Adenosine deaminase-like protein-like isoform X1 n=1 Tax=Hibiscus syriacus TaxID=106335 RepID=A0A6A3AXD5_HIBSY|nr:adenosine deaminase-like protein-like isoform X1 [Hibiscus syriacus]